jgi:hypothetical protein
MLFFQTVVSCLFYLASFASAADTNAWKSRSIYFVLTDRIARSSSDTGGGACSNLGNYCGGTFSGLESKLDYIKGLGFDAIWITPVVASKCSLIKLCKHPVLTGKIRQCWWVPRLLGARPICYQLELWHCSRLEEPGVYRAFQGIFL